MNLNANLLQGPNRAIGDKIVESGLPVCVTGEIGINGHGELSNAFALFD